MVTNNDDDSSHYLSFRISSAFQKWNELKHILTDKKIIMSTRIKLLEACIRSRLLYSAQSWKLSGMVFSEKLSQTASREKMSPKNI